MEEIPIRETTCKGGHAMPIPKEIIKQQLLQEREQLYTPMLNRENEGELNSYDQHPADLASDVVERSKDIAFHEQQRNGQQRLAAALSRLENGQYGKCLVCGHSIESGRLLALPDALSLIHI